MALKLNGVRDPIVRFRAQYQVVGECWIWTGSDVTRDGYARFHVAGRRVFAHRWAYETFVAPIPEGAVLDHVVCDTPSCVNPAHTKPSTQRVNVLRSHIALAAINARKTECIHGHPLDGVGHNPGPNRGRRCLTCHRERERARRKRGASSL